MPNQPLPASPYIGYFLPSNSRDKGEELKAPLSLYCSHFSHQLLSLSNLDTRHPQLLLVSSHLAYPNPATAFPLFASRSLESRNCSACSSYPVYSHPATALKLLSSKQDTPYSRPNLYAP